MYKYDTVENKNVPFYMDTVTDFLTLLAPFAPHLSEELWERMGMPYSIFNRKWPEWDEKALVRDETEIVIQLNGKIKEKIIVPSGMDREKTVDAAMKNEKVEALLAGRSAVKVIAVPGKLVNIVVK